MFKYLLILLFSFNSYATSQLLDIKVQEFNKQLNPIETNSEGIGVNWGQDDYHVWLSIHEILYISKSTTVLTKDLQFKVKTQFVGYTTISDMYKITCRKKNNTDNCIKLIAERVKVYHIKQMIDRNLKEVIIED